jgi:hypothetical protein
MPSPLVPFVGRAAEVAAVAAALDAAASGTARVVAVAGEPGVGKSRLVEEADALARARGFLTLRATASPLHTDLPYGIMVEALRPIVRTVEAGARTRLVEGLPDLGRLFEAVCRLFDRLTRQQPVLLVVDDLHWADPTSLALLDYVVRGLSERRFLLMVTHRTGESGPDIEALRRSGSFRALVVEPLDATGVGAFARGLLADDPPVTLTRLLVARTGGLPLFVRSLVTMLIDSGRLFRSGGRWVLGPEPVDDVPPELVGLLRSRLDALQANDRRVFDTVAVAGGRIAHDLMVMLHRDEEELLGSLKRLRGTGLLVEQLDEAGVHYQVTHPLLTEVAHGELSAVTRHQAHSAIAAALQRTGKADIGHLAHHVRGAGDQIDPDIALEVLVAATGAALDNKAGAEAAAHADAAIGLAQRAGRAELLPRLQVQRAEALEVAGRADAAIAAWGAAADTAPDGTERARRLRRLAIVEWDTGRLTESQAHIDEAAAVLPDTHPGPVHLAVAETRMRMLARRGRLAELRAEAAELERIGTITGSSRAQLFARWAQADLCLSSGDHHGTNEVIAAMMGWRGRRARRCSWRRHTALQRATRWPGATTEQRVGSPRTPAGWGARPAFQQWRSSLR